MAYSRPFALLRPVLALGLVTLAGCPGPTDDTEPELARDIFAPLGAPLPSASAEQLAAFERGVEVAQRRFAPGDGLGPTANVTFCGACHEKPVLGGSGPRYRDFYITGQALADGSFVPGGEKSGVLTSYGYGEEPARPRKDDIDNVSTHRNAIPFFGAGLIAELSEVAILENADEDDEDGDGISGRPNYDRGFVGRFGRKAQTVSIEGFIRGPLFNHLGLTSDPLTEEQKARLPVPSSAADAMPTGDMVPRQAAAPDEPLFDDDGIPDPELASEDLFDLVSFVMLTAAPHPDPLSDAALRGRLVFDAIGCNDCHVRALEGPRGLVPLYSDLLLHDMGPLMADGVTMMLASGSEFRTQPLWGVAATGPYLHDGRADTLDDAILWHAGEAEASRDEYGGLTETERTELLTFLAALGGADQRSDGLLLPSAPIPEPGQPGAPEGLVGPDDAARWLEGRALFDRDVPVAEGLGPVFNGDSCRACHFDPVIGGAGPADVNVMRHGTLTDDGFTAPPYGTILPKLSRWDLPRIEHDESVHNIFEPRQTPTVLGLGQIEAIVADAIMAGADPDDEDGDGIRGIAAIQADGRLGRFGWKAQVPSIREFVRDAMGAELGLTSPVETGFTFGAFEDTDEIPDPELTPAQIDAVAFFIAKLAPPLPSADVPDGATAFSEVGCDRCHSPSLPTADGTEVRLYSDLLLHDVAPAGTPGIDDGPAVGSLFRTPPLWGTADTEPYMHDGSAETVADAIAAHDGEASGVRDAFDALDETRRAELVRFVESL